MNVHRSTRSLALLLHAALSLESEWSTQTVALVCEKEMGGVPGVDDNDEHM
jgi:hypothetical protein